jgi:hypothetical protein
VNDHPGTLAYREITFMGARIVDLNQFPAMKFEPMSNLKPAQDEVGGGGGSRSTGALVGLAASIVRNAAIARRRSIAVFIRAIAYRSASPNPPTPIEKQCRFDKALMRHTVGELFPVNWELLSRRVYEPCDLPTRRTRGGQDRGQE